MENDHTIVQDAETLFLTGNFRKSLALCNKILKDLKPKKEGQGTWKLIPLETPLQLSFDAAKKRKRRIVLEIDSGGTATNESENADNNNQKNNNSLVDRAATVALQSWYEIVSCHQSPNSNESTASAAQGHVHLLPFLDAYAPESKASPAAIKTKHNQQSLGRPMSLELAVIFVYFLRTTGKEHIHDSLELGSEIICRTVAMGKSRNYYKTVPVHVKDSCQEIISVLFLEILPFCSSQDSVEKILRRFSTEKPTWTPATWHLETDEETHAETLRKLLSFFKKVPKSWTRHSFVHDGFIQKCRSSLRRLLKLKELHRHNQVFPDRRLLGEGETVARNEVSRSQLEEEDVSNSTPPAENKSPPVGVHRMLVPMESTLDRLRRSLHFVVDNRDSLIQALKDHRNSIALALMMLLIAWKRRRRLASVSTAALRLVLAPIQEVVDAIIKSS